MSGAPASTDEVVKADSRVTWLAKRAESAFSHLRSDRFSKSWKEAETQERILQFLDVAETHVLCIAGDSVSVSLELPKKMPKGKVLYFLKGKPAAVNRENPGLDITMHDLSIDPLEHLERVIQEVYLPVLSNPLNQEEWGEVASKEIVDKLHSFLSDLSITIGQTRGETWLPLPPVETSRSTSALSIKDRVHLLEGAVITWTKQIKNVLKLDPEMAFKAGHHPSPDVEVSFWRNKSENLNAIFDQLQSDRIRRVLQFLDANRSTYCAPFAKLCKEVFAARSEANDNVKYLRTLDDWFRKLNRGDKFEDLNELFRPVMHIILLIWKNSRYYNTPARLVVLIREICNALISQAFLYVSGRAVFEMITADEAGDAVKRLKKTLEICGEFKSTYADYKVTANTECPTNPWKIQNNALFLRLDAFLERCHDVLEMTEIIVKFRKLEKIVIGGTKGKALTFSIEDIYGDFAGAVSQFQAVPYDILDVEQKSFDDDFYAFRGKIKELERRLSAILTQGFEDQSTILGRFKLLDSFDTLLERPIIQDELERKHVALIQAYGADLKKVQEVLLLDRDIPPIGWNMPPIAGALAWCRGLKERIQLPMSKIRELSRSVLEREETKEVTKMYATLMASLDDYEHAKLEEWAADVERSSEVKLRLPLLSRGKSDASSEIEEKLLAVNFDPGLVRLLREVKYFLLLNLDVPATALAIYRSARTFRTQTGSLDIIVQQYNQITTEMLPVEVPLMKSALLKIDTTLKTGLRDMNWKSPGINAFIDEVQSLVKSTHKTLFDLKGNLDNIASILRNWQAEPILSRKAKPMTADEFENMYRGTKTSRFSSIKADGVEIEKRLKDSHSIMSVSKTHPHWIAYIDFVNSIIVQGLSKLVQNSLDYLNNQLNEEFLKKAGMQPLLVVSLDVQGQSVRFIPDIEESSSSSLYTIIQSWVESFYAAVSQVKRLDEAEGRYVREMVGDMRVQSLLATIHESLETSESRLSEFRKKYETYSWLWKDDMRSSFGKFKDTAIIEIDATEVARQVSDDDDVAAGSSGSSSPAPSSSSGQTEEEVRILLKLPDLSKYDSRISEFEGIQTEVARMTTPIDIGWLRVSTEPAKLAISKCLAQWANCLIEFLSDYITTELNEFQTFITRVRAGLTETVDASSGLEPLKRVMSYIRDVKKCMVRRKVMWRPLKQCVSLLKQHGMTVYDIRVAGESITEFLEQAPMRWRDTVTAAFTKKETIFPLQTAETGHIKEQVETFLQATREFRNEFRRNAPLSFTGAVDDAYKIIDGYVTRLTLFESGAAELNELEELFELPFSKYNEFIDTRRELKLLKIIWDFQALVNTTYESWQQLLWSAARIDSLEETNKKLRDFLKQLGNQDQIMKGWGVFRSLENQMKDMATTLPLMSSLHSQAMRPRHWKALATVCKVKSLDPSDVSFSLEIIFNLKLHTHQDDVAEVVETAEKEEKIEKKLNRIAQNWITLQLDFVQHKDSEMRVIRPAESVLEALEGDQMELQTIKGMGKFSDFFKDSIQKWDMDLQEVDEVLKVWTAVTKSWSDLEVIFMESEDIQLSLPEDTKRFSGIDGEFKELMKVAVEIPSVIESCTKDGRKEALKGMMSGLELCQKSLKDYLDMKKKRFARFYFMSADALLTTLSNGSNPPKVMPFLGDCFDSITNLRFLPITEEGSVPNRADQMKAKDGEEVMFHKPFVISGPVESWLTDLVKMQQSTLKAILQEAQETAVNWEVESEKPRHVWLEDYPAQIVLVATQIDWTEGTTRALEELEGGQEDAVKKWLQVNNDRLYNLIQRVLGKLSSDLRTKIITLITLDVHARDVIQKLVDSKADGPTAFLWLQQLRFYWEAETKDVNIRITDFKSKYFYEYLGNSGRLVITPLTDRCYITLTLALRLMLGGAPAGPAGTGKTETTKDLARALALPCYVFNCSDQMNYQSLADIFKGLAQTGAWGCFDEFNRITIEVLSVVATQVKSTLDAIRRFSVVANRPEAYRGAPAGSPPCVVGEFELSNDLITLIPTVGVFITMNPGYAGRTELPENVKALFRPCAMIRPDLPLICENMLMSEGFQNARPLSIKFVTLYQLSSELLSPQIHYDWGLRAVKAVLRVAGVLKRAEPEVVEDAILMRALRDFNTPKMPLSDLPIFLRLVQDLFPAHFGIPPKFDTVIEQNTIKACKEQGLQYDQIFLNKVVQFQELLNVRHSVFILGPAGCGKSTVWKMLAAQHNLGYARNKSPCVYEIVDPKSVTCDELYGYMTLAKDWKDGCLSIVMRGMSKNNRDLGFGVHQTMKWVVLDGDIDSVWIESMNTVMDDNKVLTLVSNERVPLTSSMRMVFEVHSLQNATPATVSRAGILYINDTDVGWRPYVDSWIQKRGHDSEKAHLPALFDKYVEFLSDAMRKSFKTITPVALISQAMTICRLLETSLDLVSSGATPEQIEHCFVFAVIWAFGAPLLIEKQSGTRGDHRKNFHDLLSTVCASVVKFPKEVEGIADPICFDFYYDPSKNEILPWLLKVDKYVPLPIGNSPGEVSFSSITVSTVDSIRITHTMDSLVKKGHAVMLVGTAGTGKTLLIETYLRNLMDPYLTTTINMNYYMDSKALQALLDNNIDKRSGRMYGPPTGKKRIFFIDDINLPYIETYGTQNSLSLLRQVMDHRQFYDREDLGLKKEIVDIQMLASMNPTAGSFRITERLQRHFTTFAVLMPSDSDLKMIYESILNGHFKFFSAEVQGMSSRLVESAILIHKKVSQFFLPSAQTFMYNWNVRELSNVFQGVCRAKSDFYPSGLKVLRLFIHELNRVFCDRLVSEEHAEKFTKLMRDIVLDKLKEYPDSDMFATPITYTSFAAQVGGDPTYLPLPIGDYGNELLVRTVTEKLKEYNENNSIMDLVLFDQAIDHVCRISRVVSVPSGNAMLVGVGGSGKQSLSRLAAFICGYETVQLSVTSKFTVLDLKEALKGMYKIAGVKDQGLIWLLTDSQIVKDEFLIYVNDFLNSGWLPDLFEQDEMDNIYNAIRNEAKMAGIASDIPEAMLDFFLSRVKKNMHLVLCFSPVGSSFRIRARRFPGLINCTTIDRFMPWPQQALESVAIRFLSRIDLGIEGDTELHTRIAQHMAFVHQLVTKTSKEYVERQRRYNYVTPKSFLEFVSFYLQQLSIKRHAVGGQIMRLEEGLAKLSKTASDVADLQLELEDTMIRVQEKASATDVLLKQISTQREEAAVQEEAASKVAETAKQASEEASEIEKQAEIELADAKPKLLKAEEAVKCLNKRSIDTLKALTSPPAACADVAATVLIMVFGERKDMSWRRGQRMMSNVQSFLDDLTKFDARTLTDEILVKLQPYLEKPYFNELDMKGKSEAASNLCAFVVNTVDYYSTYIKVKPLMDRLAEATGKKDGANALLDKAMLVVNEVRLRLSKLEEQLLQATNEKLAVERDAEAYTLKLALAKRLINGLASENTRWGIDVESLKSQELKLVGDVLLASGFVSYLGAFDFSYRNLLWKTLWIPDIQARTIPLSDDVDPLKLLVDEGKIAKMQWEGLPSDRISTENGAIVVSSKRWPLMIDPQLQAIKWLRKREEPNGLRVVQLSSAKWVAELCSCISSGIPVIMENCLDDLDATLDPILSRSVYQKGRTLFLNIGGEEVEYDVKFKLYLQTKLSNPHYKPEIQAQCTLVNFIASEVGLQDQLLAKVVNEEKAELEEQKQKLAAKFNEYKMQLLQLEDELLTRLANAPADILSDVPLIEGLEATKKASIEINHAVEKGKETEADINKARQVYVPVAEEGAMLYFLINQLDSIEYMYRYSLDSFEMYFYKSIREAPKSDKLSERVQYLRETLRFVVCQWVSRGLFEEHKLILLSQLTFLLMSRGKLEEEFNLTLFKFLLRPTKKLGEAKPASCDWLPDSAWQCLLGLAALDGGEFSKLPSDLDEAPARFKEWFNHITPEVEKLPLDWSGLDKTPFKKLCVLRCMRPDRLTIAMTHFITKVLPNGKMFVEGDSTLGTLQVMEATLADSRPSTPIYFILSAGADIVSDIDKLALKHGFEKGLSYHNVSMGQGQDKHAEEALHLAHKQGHWVILNNVHLMPKWLTKLEKLLDLFNMDGNGKGSHEKFRLFLTSDPSSAIPIGILNRSIKLTNEPPSGLKANLKRAFCSFIPEYINEIDSKTRSILFGLCFFHAVMIERKKFGAKGFNMTYPFSLGDLRDSSVCLSNYMENAGSKIPWEDLRYIFGQIMYGGHIVNDFDRLLCTSYLEHFMKDELLDEMELFPFNKEEKDVSFISPSPTTYERYIEHIDEKLKGDTPIAFGLHPNAEIGFRTDQSEKLFQFLNELQPRDSSGSEGETTPRSEAEKALQEFLDTFGETKFEVDDISSALEERGPFQNVLILELEHMNRLLVEIKRSLEELKLGFDGQLTMTEAMDSLEESIYLNRIPKVWGKLAWPSLRSLMEWRTDLSLRINQLIEWSGDPTNIPRVTWISGLANPQSFLTAIRQQTAQRSFQELDKLEIQTEVTKKLLDEIDAPSRDGAYIHGLFIQGARWDITTGVVDKSRPREMNCDMPVINCKAVSFDKVEEKNIYKCPVYKTEQRGPTYVFMAQLKTKSPFARWVMAGVALIMDVKG